MWRDEEQYEHIACYTANGQPLAYSESSGKLHFQHADYLGTVRYVTTDTGAGESVA